MAIGEKLIETGRLKFAGRTVVVPAGAISGAAGAGGRGKKRQSGEDRESENGQECFHFRQV